MAHWHGMSSMPIICASLLNCVVLSLMEYIICAVHAMMVRYWCMLTYCMSLCVHIMVSDDLCPSSTKSLSVHHVSMQTQIHGNVDSTKARYFLNNMILFLNCLYYIVYSAFFFSSSYLFLSSVAI